MSLYDDLEKAPNADFSELLRKKPKKRFLVKSDEAQVPLSNNSTHPPAPEQILSNLSNSEKLANELINSNGDSTTKDTTILESLDLLSNTIPNQIEKKSTIVENLDVVPTIDLVSNSKESIIVDSLDVSSNEDKQNLPTYENNLSDHAEPQQKQNNLTEEKFVRNRARVESSSNETFISTDTIENFDTKNTNHRHINTTLSTIVKNLDIETTSNIYIKSTIVDSIYKNSTMIDSLDIETHSIRFKSNFTKFYNDYFEGCKNLSSSCQIIYSFLYRLSYGWGKNITSIPLSASYLSVATGLSHVTVRNSIKFLLESGIIEKFKDIPKKGTIYNIKSITGKSEINNSSNFTCVDNNLFDYAIKALSQTEFCVYLYLFRLSYGYNRDVTIGRVGAATICDALNISRRPVILALRGLIIKNCIKRVGHLSTDGFLYKVILPQEFDKSIPNNTEIKQINSINSAMIESIDIKSTIVKNKTPLIKTTIDDSIDDNLLNNNNTLETNKESSIVDSVDNKRNEKIKKTSSDDADLFFTFLNQNFKDQRNEFPISKSVVEKYLSKYGLEVCKKHIIKLNKKIMEADSSVGFWINSLKNPENYPELNEADKHIQKQQEIIFTSRERAFEEEQKRNLETIFESFWQNLSQEKQQSFINEKRTQMGEGRGDLKIPEAVIKKAAMEFAFWQDSQNLFKNLSIQDQETRLNEAKSNIIKRVYVQKNEDGNFIVPEQLPKTEFSERVSDLAEKIAVMEFYKKHSFKYI